MVKGMVMVAGLILLTGTVFLSAESGNHYPNGVEGIKAGSVPPPGVYLRTYFFYYHAGRLNDPAGQELPVGFDVNVFALAPRLIWVSKYKFLGADVVWDVMIPLLYTGLEVDAAHVNESTFGLGDIYFSPLILAWHRPRGDAVLGFSFFAPTGSWDRHDPTKAGKDYWTFMISGGGTVHLDPAKTWSASWLGRYEFHAGRRDMDVNLGDDFHFEWGISHSFHKTMDLGLVGYGQFQTTADSGADLAPGSDSKDRALAMGGEYSNVFPAAKLIFSVRFLKEFSARDRPSGYVFNTTLTKIF